MEKQNETTGSKLNTYILENTSEGIRELYASLAEYAETHHFGVLDKDVVVLDTETTGFSFHHDELIQIAAARMRDKEIVEWYVTFVNPNQSIPEEVVHLTHISDEDVADAPDPDTALRGLVDFVGDSYVVAHNANFDRTFTTKRAAGESLKNNLWIDSLDLARIALPRFNSHRLLDLVRAFGGPDSTHRADDDVAATCLVYRILLAGVANMPASLVSYIANSAETTDWNTVWVFQQMATADAEPYNLRSMRRAATSADMPELRKDVFVPHVSEDTDLEPEYPWSETGEVSEAQPIGEELAEVVRLEFATDEEIKAAFSSEGLIGQLYEDYELREEQRTMALAVNRAISQSENLAVEAGTGVGKSMAYLVPLAMAAQKNNMTVGVATKTNALLDQLVNKELPLLKEALGITYAPLKGYTHYPCLRKIDTLVKRGPRQIEFKGQKVQQAPALAGLLSYIDQTLYDDMDNLKVDYRAIPRYSITCKSTECLKRKCPFAGRTCFVHGARDQAQRSDVVVTNHSLLFWDVRFEGGLLPPIRYWVVDEAHGAEEEARRAFSTSISSDSVRSLVRRISSDSTRSNVFLRAQQGDGVPEEAKTLYNSLVIKAINAGQAVSIAAEEYVLSVKDLLFFDTHSKKSGYETFDLWLNEEIRQSETFRGVSRCAIALYESLEKVIRASRDLVAYCESIDLTSANQRDIALAALELRELYEALDVVFIHEKPNSVYSVRLTRTKSQLNDVFTVQPMQVGNNLNETLYQETNSVIFASATLAVDQDFTSFESAIGLNESEDSRGTTLQIDSSYDFDHNMRVFVPSDMPDPTSPAYLSTLEKFLTELHLAQEGSMLTLFTNRKEMEKCFDGVHPALKEKDLRLVCQKWGVSVKGLRDDFLKDEHLSLFALKSFWEGFDAPGATLKGVVIPKLPFGLPNDPLYLERRGVDDRAWAHYVLPSAVIDVKQAVGRLIRTSTDEGIVVLADSRLISKYYGRKFLNSLPSNNVSIMPMEDIVEAIRNGSASA